MGTLKRQGRSEAIVEAPSDAVWAIVSDPTRVGEWSHECLEAHWLDGATAAAPGARFQGRNRVGRVGWARVNEVVAVDAPNELVWRTVPTWMYPDSTEWRIAVEPADGKTRIVQSFTVLKLNPLMDRLIYLVTPAHRDRSEALAADMQRLGDLARRNVDAT